MIFQMKFLQTDMKKKISVWKLILMISGMAVVFLTTPAWPAGMVFAALAALVLGLAVWKIGPDDCCIKNCPGDHSVLCLSVVIISAYGVNFYNNWLDSSYVEKITDLLHIAPAVFMAFAAVAGTLICVPAVAYVVKSAFDIAKDDFRQKKQLESPGKGRCVSARQAMLILFVIYVVGFSAVLRTNFYYLDDNGRAAFGYKTWDYFGRYLSTGFSTLLHMGEYLTDIAPLPQLAALLLMAVSSVVLMYVLFDRTSFSLWEIAAVVPLGLNPYFLECLSFRFDAPYMAVSVLAGILPLLYRKKRTVVYLLASMLGTLAVCTSYQAATGIFPVLVIMLALRMWNSGKSMKETLLFCMRSAGGYLLGMIYFKLVIMRPADAGYVSNALPEASGMVDKVIGNYKTFYGLILTDFQPLWLGLVALLAVVFLVMTVVKSVQKKPAALAMGLASLVMMVLLCFGAYPALEAVLFSPRAMYGFGVLLTVLCLTTAEGWENIPAKMPAIVLSWVFFVFSFTYGNALDLQKEYTDFRIHMVYQDLNDLEAFRTEDVILRLTGETGLAPVIQNMPQDGQILNRLVPVTFAGGDDLSGYRFFEYFGIQKVLGQDSGEAWPLDMPVIKDGIFHTICGEDNRILVILK